MKTIGNILWLILVGVWLAIGYAVAGVVMCITIIGIPFGIPAFKLAGFVLWPFGRKVVSAPGALGVLAIVFNILWLLLFGWGLFLSTLVLGVLLCITIIGIPFGIASFRIGAYALWPFGRTTVERRDAGAPSFIVNILWLVLAGWWLALAHIVTGLLQCVTIIGIPLGIANFKLIPVSLFPLGREIVSTDQPFTSSVR